MESIIHPPDEAGQMTPEKKACYVCVEGDLRPLVGGGENAPSAHELVSGGLGYLAASLQLGSLE